MTRKSPQALGPVPDFSEKYALSDAWGELREDIDSEDIDFSLVETGRDDFLIQSMAPALINMAKKFEEFPVVTRRLGRNLSVSRLGDDRNLIIRDNRASAAVVVSFVTAGGKPLADTDSKVAFIHLSVCSDTPGARAERDMLAVSDMVNAPKRLSDILANSMSSGYLSNLSTKMIPLSPNQAPKLSDFPGQGYSAPALRMISQAIVLAGLKPMVAERAKQLASMEWEHYYSEEDLPYIRLGMGMAAAAGGLMTSDLQLLSKDIMVDYEAVRARCWVGSLWETIPCVGDLGHSLEAGSEGFTLSSSWRLKSKTEDNRRALVISDRGKTSTIVMNKPPQETGSTISIHDGEGFEGTPMAFFEVTEKGLWGHSCGAFPGLKSRLYAQDMRFDIESITRVHNLVAMLPEYIHAVENVLDLEDDGAEP